MSSREGLLLCHCCSLLRGTLHCPRRDPTVQLCRQRDKSFLRVLCFTQLVHDRCKIASAGRSLTGSPLQLRPQKPFLFAAQLIHPLTEQLGAVVAFLQRPNAFHDCRLCWRQAVRSTFDLGILCPRASRDQLCTSLEQVNVGIMLLAPREQRQRPELSTLPVEETLEPLTNSVFTPLCRSARGGPTTLYLSLEMP